MYCMYCIYCMELQNIYFLPNISEEIIMMQNDKWRYYTRVWCKKRHIRKKCFNKETAQYLSIKLFSFIDL